MLTWIRHRIDAISFVETKASDEYPGRERLSIYGIGILIESTLRSMNNIEELLHQSFFLYVMTESGRFISIANYIGPVAVLIAGIMLTAIFLELEHQSKMDKKKTLKKADVLLNQEKARNFTIVFAVAAIIGTSFYRSYKQDFTSVSQIVCCSFDLC